MDEFLKLSVLQIKVRSVTRVESRITLTLSYRGGAKYAPLFFLHHPETPQAINLKLSGYSQNLAPKKSEKSVICKAIELKFGMNTSFGSLSSKSSTIIKFEVSMTS